MSADAPAHDRRVPDKRIEEIEKNLSENTLLTAENSRQIDDIDTKVEKLHTAMFAKDSANEFETPGVMTTMKRLDAHLDVICTWAKWGKRFLATIASIVTFAVPILVALRQMGII